MAEIVRRHATPSTAQRFPDLAPRKAIHRGLTIPVTVLDAGTLPRSEGKAVRLVRQAS